MENFINNIKNVVSPDVLIYIVIVLVAIIILTIVMMVLRQKQARRQLDKLELSYNSLKGIPLALKLNRAAALSRVNEEMSQRVESCRTDFDSIQEQLKEYSVTLTEADDLVYVHKAKAAKRRMERLREQMIELEGAARDINQALDSTLEQGSGQRVHINKLKSDFRIIRRNINENRASFPQSYEYLEMEIAAIEKMFSAFEEWMFASEFNKAADQQKEIWESVAHLKELVDVLPSIYERARGVFPRAIDEVGYQYAQAKNKGVYAEHLEVRKNLDIISNMLKNDLNKLRNGSPKDVHEDLDDCERRVSQLAEQLSREEATFDEVSDNVDILFDTIRSINMGVEAIEELYNRVCERSGFENWTQRLQEVHERLSVLNDVQCKLEAVIAQDKVPYSTILIAYKELEQSAAAFTNEVGEMKQKLDNACSNEERAKRQLIKLQLIVNEIRVKMSKRRLSSVSQKYEDDLYKGEITIKDIQVILDNSPLDVKCLNAELRSATDYIYTLYNSANNLVGMAIMAENMIVSGNRYRSPFPDIDSELTRAELCFQNRQYIKALKIDIQYIEKMHPEAYEKLINKKDPSILNARE